MRHPVDVGKNNVDKDGNPVQIVCGALELNQGDQLVMAMIG